MTPELRTYLKKQMDTLARARVEHENRLGMFRYCTGCEGEYANWTAGCDKCRDRHTGYVRHKGEHPRGTRWYEEARAAHVIYVQRHRPRRKGGYHKNGKGRAPTISGRVTHKPQEAAA